MAANPAIAAARRLDQWRTGDLGTPSPTFRNITARAKSKGRGKMKLTGYVFATALAMTTALTAAYAVEPVGSDAFNTHFGKIDLANLTADNFYDTIVPLAQAEGTVVFFDFTNSFEPLFREQLIPASKANTGSRSTISAATATRRRSS